MLEKKSRKSITQKEILNTGCKVTLIQNARSKEKRTKQQEDKQRRPFLNTLRV